MCRRKGKKLVCTIISPGSTVRIAVGAKVSTGFSTTMGPGMGPRFGTGAGSNVGSGIGSEVGQGLRRGVSVLGLVQGSNKRKVWGSV